MDNENKEKRGQWGSKIGFILAAAGSAVGLGNLWKFPYITYKYEGGAFVMVYLLAILLIGLPLMIAELLVGKKMKKNPVGAFKGMEASPDSALPSKRSEKSMFLPWRIVGWMGVAAGFIILSYYSVVAGWTLEYTFKAVRGEFNIVYLNAKKEIDTISQNKNSKKFLELKKQYAPKLEGKEENEKMVNSLASKKMSKIFGSKFLANPWKQIGFHFIFMFLTSFVIIGGISGGIEKCTKILMPCLFVIMILLLGTSMMTGAFMETIRFLFTWKLSSLTSHSILEALGHAFFTLSLGMGAILTYGSYLNKKTDLVKSAIIITVLDTCIAFIACLILFPIIFHYNLQPESGGLGILFTTLPIIFNQMFMGHYVSILFFMLLSFAALTSTISLMEVVVSYIVDEWKITRKIATITSGLIIFVFGIPSALCNGANDFFTKITIFSNGGEKLNWLDSFDYLATNWLLPLGGFFIAICVGWYLTDEERLSEFILVDGNSIIYKSFKFLIRFVSPVLVGIIILNKIGVF